MRKWGRIFVLLIVITSSVMIVTTTQAFFNRNHTMLEKNDITLIDFETIAHINATGNTIRTHAWGNYLLLAGGPTSQIYNLTDIYHPTFVANISTVSTGGYVADNKAYLAGNGLKIYNLTDPAHPSFLGANYSKSAYDVLVKDDHAYVTTGGALAFAGFAIADVLDPTNPFYESFTISAGDWSTSRCLALKGDLAFFAGDLTTNMYVIDISNPKGAWLYSTTDLGYYPISELAIHKNYGYILGTDVLNIYDITAPTNIELVSQYELESRPWDICVDNDVAYICLNNSKLLILDVEDPTEPELITEHPCEAIPIGVSSHNNFTFVSEGENGVEIIVEMVTLQPGKPISLDFYGTLFLFLPILLLANYLLRKKR